MARNSFFDARSLFSPFAPVLVSARAPRFYCGRRSFRAYYTALLSRVHEETRMRQVRHRVTKKKKLKDY
jgi:predicted NodU family carbamoyl transferase